MDRNNCGSPEPCPGFREKDLTFGFDNKTISLDSESTPPVEEDQVFCNNTYTFAWEEIKTEECQYQNCWKKHYENDCNDYKCEYWKFNDTSDEWDVSECQEEGFADRLSERAIFAFDLAQGFLGTGRNFTNVTTTIA